MSNRSNMTRRSVLVGAAALTSGSFAYANSSPTNPSSQARPQLSVVGACTVTDCKFNEDHQCHAGEIEMRVGSTGAVCGTYQPEGQTRPRP